MSHFRDIIYSVMADREDAEAQLTTYSVKEAVLSNLNIHIRNIPGHKRNFYVSMFLNKDASETIFPEAHQGWTLVSKGAQLKREGVYLNFATYQRDMSESEIDQQQAEYDLEEAMENEQEDSN